MNSNSLRRIHNASVAPVRDVDTIRVLHVCGSLAGGVGAVLMNYYRHIDRSRVQFDFLTHNAPDPAVVDEIIAMGGRVATITPKSKSLWRNLRETYAFINRKTPHDVVHVHTASPTSFSYLAAAKLAGKPVRIPHSHATDLERPPGSLQHRVHSTLRPILRWTATDLFACSVAAGDWLFGRTGGRAVTVLPNAIDTEQFRFSAKSRQETRNALGLQDCHVVGHVGRFTYAKNHHFLVEMFSYLAEREPRAVLMLVGDGELVDDVRGQVQRLGLENRTRFMGQRTDVADLLQAMDILVLPSRFEGLPVVLIEAQAAGLRCIAPVGISEEVQLTDLIEIADLVEGPRAWANLILERAQILERRDTSFELAALGYEIQTAAAELQEYYATHARQS